MKAFAQPQKNFSFTRLGRDAEQGLCFLADEARHSCPTLRCSWWQVLPASQHVGFCCGHKTVAELPEGKVSPECAGRYGVRSTPYGVFTKVQNRAARCRPAGNRCSNQRCLPQAELPRWCCRSMDSRTMRSLHLRGKKEGSNSTGRSLIQLQKRNKKPSGTQGPPCHILGSSSRDTHPATT